jgi:hypothetical protein
MKKKLYLLMLVVSIATASQQTQTIETLSFKGNESISDETLKRELKDFIGDEITLDTLKELINKSTLFYQSNGFPRAYAYIFANEIKNGEVVIQIRAGKREYYLQKQGNILSFPDNNLLQNYLNHKNTLPSKEISETVAKSTPIECKCTCDNDNIAGHIIEGKSLKRLLKEVFPDVSKTVVGIDYLFTETFGEAGSLEAINNYFLAKELPISVKQTVVGDILQLKIINMLAQNKEGTNDFAELVKSIGRDMNSINTRLNQVEKELNMK